MQARKQTGKLALSSGMLPTIHTKAYSSGMSARSSSHSGQEQYGGRAMRPDRTRDGDPLLEAAQADGQAAEHLAAPEQMTRQNPPRAHRQHPYTKYVILTHNLGIATHQLGLTVRPLSGSDLALKGRVEVRSKPDHRDCMAYASSHSKRKHAPKAPLSLRLKWVFVSDGWIQYAGLPVSEQVFCAHTGAFCKRPALSHPRPSHHVFRVRVPQCIVGQMRGKRHDVLCSVERASMPLFLGLQSLDPLQSRCPELYSRSLPRCLSQGTISTDLSGHPTRHPDADLKPKPDRSQIASPCSVFEPSHHAVLLVV